jgi:cation diffusion facilitator family transporter
MADAWHHRSDAITSIAAFIGISVALIGGPGYESADDWAALAACFVIAYNGSRLFRSAIREIIDAAPPPELEQRVRSMAAGVEGVIGIDKCRIRKSGLVTFIDIHVVVEGEITVDEGHEIAHRVKDILLASELVVQDVSVHIEPPSELERSSTDY